jgi:hypothetical protein
VTTWLLLTYRIPREPSAGRVYVWRKLKRLGALPMQDAIWVLPTSPWTREQFQWLAAEIAELGGEAWCWEARLVLPSQDAALVGQFHAQVEPGYRAILAALAAPDPDLRALAQRYQQVHAQDYCAAPVGAAVRAALLAAPGGAER